MSATGRGAERREADFYPTPAEPVRALLDALQLMRSGVWLEPAVGNGAIVRAVEEHQPGDRRWLGCDVRAVETHPDVDFFPGSFLTRADIPAPHVVITNPPYSLALPFVRRALEVVDPGGIVVMLLRLGFLESQKRAAWLAQHMPDVYPLAKRPSFTGKGTDATAYGWFVWRGDGVRSFGIIHPPIGACS